MEDQNAGGDNAAENIDNKAGARRPLTQMEQFSRQIESPGMKANIAAQLPPGVDCDRFIRTVMTVVRMQPELLEADRTSLLGACMLAAKDGLNPDGKEATIQIYNKKVKGPNGDTWIKIAQYMPMVRGLLKQLFNTGLIATIDAAAVYEKDQFIFERGDNPRLVHTPYMGAEHPGNVVAAYAVVHMKDGEIKREVMPRRDIEKIREESKAKDGPGWTKWYDQFAIKAVLKRIYKQLPASSEAMDRIIKHDNDALGIEFQQQVISRGGQTLLENAAEIKAGTVLPVTGNAARPSRFAETLASAADAVKGSAGKQESAHDRPADE